MSPTCRTTTTDGGQPVGDGLDSLTGSDLPSVLERRAQRVRAVRPPVMMRWVYRSGACPESCRDGADPPEGLAAWGLSEDSDNRLSSGDSS
jgi:hypothetical protein